MQPDLEIAFLQHGRSFRIGSGNKFSLHRFRRERLPRAYIPHHHRARAIVAFGNRAFKVEVRNRMILHLHGQAFVGRIERRAFGHRPGLEHAFHLQAEVIVQPSGPVLLHHKTVLRFLLQLVEVAREFPQSGACVCIRPGTQPHSSSWRVEFASPGNWERGIQWVCNRLSFEA